MEEVFEKNDIKINKSLKEEKDNPNSIIIKKTKKKGNL
tara:strand:- start:147 stop:260 length:114 start_codon:yes stop_codon:yes gene_type:complete